MKVCVHPSYNPSTGTWIDGTSCKHLETFHEYEVFYCECCKNILIGGRNVYGVMLGFPKSDQNKINAHYIEKYELDGYTRRW
jgi:hypothetical protein